MKHNTASLISVGGGANQMPLISAAISQGHHVLIIDREHFCHEESEYVSHLKASTWDQQSILDQLHTKRHHKYDGILSRNSGPATLTAAFLAAKLGCNGIPLQLAQCSVSKSYLREYLRDRKLPFIQGIQTETLDHWQHYPALIKPDQPLIGKKNVYKVESEKSEKIYACIEESINDQADVSEWVDGIDVTVMLNVALRKNSYFIFEELVGLNTNKIQGLGLRTPAPIGSQLKNMLIKSSLNFIKPLPSACGIFFFTFRITPNKQVFLYEVNAGLSGDMIAERLFKSSFSDIDPFLLDLQNTLGQHQNLPDEPLPSLIYYQNKIDQCAEAAGEYNNRLKRFLKGAPHISFKYEDLKLTY